METMKELILVQKPIMLDEGNFGHWKARMRHVIRSMNEDAWTAVVHGWKEPTTLDENQKVIPKPIDKWTEAEKSASKYNSKAISAIFMAVDLEQFELIQGCEAAKDAWDTLVTHFEGDSNVRRTRIDHLASRFENLKMDNDESITSFATKLSSIANEATVLGKKYKEKKLVKKLLRCLPPKYHAHKAVLKMAMNTDDMKFDQLVGMLKAEELETESDKPSKSKGIAFTTQTEDNRVQQIEENLRLMAKNFNKMVKRFEQEGDGSAFRNSRNDGDKNLRKKDLQCHECEGFGHFRSECPLTKRKELKCIECKGFGHTRNECPSSLKKSEKSLLCSSDSESNDEEEEELMLNFVARVSHTDVSVEAESSEGESDDEHIDPKLEIKNMYDKCVMLSNENLLLIKEKAMMKAHLNILEMERSEGIKDEPKGENNSVKETWTEFMQLKGELAIHLKEKQEMNQRLGRLSEIVEQERKKRQGLESQLTENHKKIRMLNSGTKNLDQILSMGQPPKVNWGLGYQGAKSSSNAQISNLSNFIAKQDKILITKPAVERKEERKTHIKRGCHFCGKSGHSWRRCYTIHKRVKLAWSLGECYPEPTQYLKAWIPKDVLYGRRQVNHINDGSYDPTNLTCFFAASSVSHTATTDSGSVKDISYTATKSQDHETWYFNSGCSRHMNIHGLQMVVQEGAVRGMPSVESATDKRCESVNVICDDKQQLRTSEVLHEDSCVTHDAERNLTTGINQESFKNQDSSKEYDYNSEETEVRVMSEDLVHQNQFSKDVIGDVLGERITQKKVIDFKEMLCMMNLINSLDGIQFPNQKV